MRFLAKDSQFRTVLVDIYHNSILGKKGGGEGEYYHLSQNSYNFLKAIEQIPNEEGYLLYSTISGIPEWKLENIPILNHNDLEGIQGGVLDDYYHLTFSEHSWLVGGYNDGLWSIDKGGTGFVSYTSGDLLVGNSGGELSKLGIGTEGQVLKIVGGNVVWGEVDAISNHNELSGIQGGEGPDGYYHLTSSEHSWLVGGYNDGLWSIDKGGTGFVSYTSGDLLVGNSGGELSKLGIGTEGQVLKIVGGNIVWGEVVVISNHNELSGIQGGALNSYYHLTSSEYSWLIGGYNDGLWDVDKGGTGFVSYTSGDLLVGNSGGELSKLGIGTEGQVLKIVGGNIVWGDSGIILNHNDLGNIQGGESPNSYYHLTQPQHVWLTDGYNDGYWDESKGGTGETSFNSGDLLVGNSNNKLIKLNVGEDGYRLTSNSGVLKWEPGYYHAVLAGKIGLVGSNYDGYILTNLSMSAFDDFPVFIPPIDSYLRNLMVKVGTAPGIGESVTVTVRKNDINTDLKCTIIDNDNSNYNESNLLRVIAGDKVSMRVETSSGANVEDLASIILVYPDSTWDLSYLVQPGDQWLWADLDADNAMVFNTQPNILNPGFETGDPPTNWLGYFANISSELIDVYEGSQSLKIFTTTANGIGYQAFLIPNNRYLSKLAMKTEVGGQMQVAIGGVFNYSTINSSWALHTFEDTASNDTYRIRVMGLGTTGWADSVTAKNLSLNQITCKGTLGNLAQATAANMPWSSDADAPTSVPVNGKRVLYGDGPADRLATAGLMNWLHNGAGGTYATTLTVGASAYLAFATGNATNCAKLLANTNGSLRLLVYDAVGAVVDSSSAAGTLTATHKTVVVRISSAACTVRVNGATVISVGATAGMSALDSTPFTIYPSSNGVGSKFTISRYLSNDECAKLESYLRSYYAL